MNGTEKYSIILKKINYGLEKSAELMGMDSKIQKILLSSINEFEIQIPVRLKNNRIEIFKGYSVQFGSFLRPFEDRIKYNEDLRKDELKSLAMIMTLKAGVFNISFRGVKNGLKINANNYSKDDIEKITRRFIQVLNESMGSKFYIAAPSLNINPFPGLLVWDFENYTSAKQTFDLENYYHVYNCGPIGYFGISEPYKADVQGIVYLILDWARENGIALKDSTYMVQGFGNVASLISRYLKRLGAKLIAVQDSSGTIISSKGGGYDPEKLDEHVSKYIGVRGFQHAQPMDDKTFFKTKADILIASDPEKRITNNFASLLNVKLIVESENGVLGQSENILLKKGIDIIPDILCRSGSFLSNYQEWLKIKKSICGSQENGYFKLDDKMIEAYHRIKKTAKKFSTDIRTAVLIVALSNLEKAYNKIKIKL